MNDDRNDRSDGHSNDDPDDAEIARLFESDPAPARRPGYWDDIHATLVAVDAEEAGAERVVEAFSRNRDTERPALRPSTMNTIQEQQVPHTDAAVRGIDTARSANRRTDTRGRILLAAAVLLIGGGIGVAALSTIDRSTSTETTTEPVGSTEVVQSTTDIDESAADTTGGAETDESTGADPTAPATLVNQAEPGLQFDFGALARIEQIDGEWWIWFDRYSVDGASGPELTEPFSTAFASDAAPIGNVNPGLRTYRLAADATMELIDPAAYDAICGGEAGPDEPFITSTLDDLPSDLSRTSPYSWTGTMLASLSFNDAGEVSLISDSRSC